MSACSISPAIFVSKFRGALQCYASPVLKLFTAPETNDRGPRYMERALAAIHQANQQHEPITLLYGASDDRVALFVRVAEHIDELVTSPIAANYPNCSLVTVEQNDDVPPEFETWSAELELCPELFPILRHAQFEDLLLTTAQRGSTSQSVESGYGNYGPFCP